MLSILITTHDTLSLTVRFLETSAGTASTVLLGLTATGVANEQRPVVIQ